ncbi:thioredoxin-like protein Clot [Phragmites australis]|uniref:thioredoxin-like protein Clot n=1 Tax=Phragmites australis TaxID=29695 RepID=UPI002D7A37E6|nr:thioredoxin-like protein Clot [Phragmites australis]
MTVEKVDASLADFDAHFERLFGPSDDGKVKLLLFLADRDPSTSLTWCSDCNVAEPVIYEKLEALQGRDVMLLRAYVGDKPTWRDTAHPWRVDPRFGLKGVPTLIRWEKGAAAARLEDDEAHLGDKIDVVLGAGGN